MVIPFVILNVDGNLVQTSLMVNKEEKNCGFFGFFLGGICYSEVFSQTFQLFFLILEERAINGFLVSAAILSGYADPLNPCYQVFH